MSIKLYHFPRACSQVSMNALEEAGVTYEDEVVNIMTGAQKSPEYLAVHRSGKVPALSVDGQVITENASILMYIHNANPDAGLLPNSGDPVAAALQRSDLVWCTGTVHPAVRQMMRPERYTDGDTSGIVAKGRELVTDIANHIEGRLEPGGWWYGEHWSIVDVYLNWLCTIAGFAGFNTQDYSNIQDLMARVQARPSFQSAQRREAAAAAAAGLKAPG